MTLMRRMPLRAISSEQLVKQQAWWRLVEYLIRRRAQGKCELCHYQPERPSNLQGHHIIKRALGEWTAKNCIILCKICHGKQISSDAETAERLLGIVARLNKKHGIEPGRGWTG